MKYLLFISLVFLFGCFEVGNEDLAPRVFPEVSNITNTSVLVTWNNPGDCEYLVYLDTGTVNKKDKFKSYLDVKDTFCFVDGLLPSTKYGVTVTTIKEPLNPNPSYPVVEFNTLSH